MGICQSNLYIFAHNVVLSMELSKSTLGDYHQTVLIYVMSQGNVLLFLACIRHASLAGDSKMGSCPFYT